MVVLMRVALALSVPYTLSIHSAPWPQACCEPGPIRRPLHRYFLTRWQDTNVPEYDLNTDELVYRDRLGNEMLRERFQDVLMISQTVTER
jgi:hypothetical protein